MDKVFICYRHVDSEERAHRIHDWLAEHYGDEQIFIDIHDIAGGDNFVDVIANTLQGTQVMLVIIGSEWENEFIKRAPLDEIDYVHEEIVYGLNNIPLVIPVLLDKTIQIDENNLPDDVVPLTQRQYEYCRSGRDFSRDVADIKRRIDKHLQTQQPAGGGETGTMSGQSSVDKWTQIVGAIVGVVGLIVSIIFGILSLREPAPVPTPTLSPTTVTQAVDTDTPQEVDTEIPTNTPTPVTPTEELTPTLTRTPAPTEVVSMGPVDLTIYITGQSLTIVVPRDSDDRLAMSNLVFGYRRQGTEIRKALSDFPAFSVGLDSLTTPRCFRFVLDGTSPIPPMDCANADLGEQILLPTDLFWYQNNASSPFTIYSGENAQGSCLGGQSACSITYTN